MSSYTAQLFESLKRSAAAPSTTTPDPSRQLGYTFTIPEVDAPTPLLSVNEGGASFLAARGDRVTLASSVQPRVGVHLRPPPKPNVPIGLAALGSDAPTTGSLPQELEDCYAVIRSQRNQVAQLRERAAILEEQVAEVGARRARAVENATTAADVSACLRLRTAQYREKVIGFELHAGAHDSESAVALSAKDDEIATLRSTIEVQASEMARLRDERGVLMKKLLESKKAIETTRAAAEKEKNELAYRLGKENAAAVQAATAAALARSAAQTPGRLSSHERGKTTPSADVPASAKSTVKRVTISLPDQHDNEEEEENAAAADREVDSAHTRDGDDESTAYQSVEVADTNSGDDADGGKGSADVLFSPSEKRSAAAVTTTAASERRPKSSVKGGGGSFSGNSGEDESKRDPPSSSSSSSSSSSYSNSKGRFDGSSSGSSSVKPQQQQSLSLSGGLGLFSTLSTSSSSSSRSGIDAYADMDAGANAYLARQDQLRQQEAVLQSLRAQQVHAGRAPTALSTAIGASVGSLPYQQQQSLLGPQPSASSSSTAMGSPRSGGAGFYGQQPLPFGGDALQQQQQYGGLPSHQRGASGFSSLSSGGPSSPSLGLYQSGQQLGGNAAIGGAGGYPLSYQQQHQQQLSSGSGWQPQIQRQNSVASVSLDPSAMQAAYEYFASQHQIQTQQQQQQQPLPTQQQTQPRSAQLERQQQQQLQQQKDAHAAQEADMLAAANAAAAAGAASSSSPIAPAIPLPGQRVTQAPAKDPPPGGYTIYAYPPKGTGPWPDGMVFFQPLVEVGIPFMKHGRQGRPHKRLLWLDISNPTDPTLMWQEGDFVSPERVKEKDRLRLVDIEDVRSGRSTDVLKKSGRDADESKYVSLSFVDGSRTLDMEMPTPEARDWLFKKFAELFQAYATAQTEDLSGDAITLRVADILDGPVGGGGRGGGSSPSSAQQQPQQQQQQGGSESTGGGRRSGGGQQRQRQPSYDPMNDPAYLAAMQQQQQQQFGANGYGGGQQPQPLVSPGGGGGLRPPTSTRPLIY